MLDVFIVQHLFYGLYAVCIYKVVEIFAINLIDRCRKHIAVAVESLG